jgi:hypothetical protein
MSTVFSATLAFVAMTAPTLAGGTTWTVDDNGGADFVHIQDAIDSALPGDVILIEAGAYAGFTVDGKPLTIKSVTDQTVVQVSAFVEVRNIPVGTQLDLTGLRIGEPWTIGGAPATTIEDCWGTVRFVDCSSRGWDPTSTGCPYLYLGGTDCISQVGISIRSCAEVVFLRCTLKGGSGSSHDYNHDGYATAGASGITVDESVVNLLESTAWGGYGGGWYGHCYDGEPGGHGIEISNFSALITDRSTLRPGDGGPGGIDYPPFDPPCAGNNGPNGYGIHADATSAGTFKDANFQAPPGREVGGSGATAVDEAFFAPYCLGTFEDCPCSNSGHGVSGCENAHVVSGARLEATGVPSISADTIRLTVSGLNPNATPSGLFFQGTARVDDGTVLHDGLLCAGGDIIRLRGKVAMGGTASYGFGNPHDGEISVRGALPASGGRRFYQVWYRSQPGMFCPPERFNMSNGIEIVWGP